jgi:hypothetical protein
MAVDLGLFNDPSMADPDAAANASSGEIEWLDPSMFTGDYAITDDNSPALTELLTGTGDIGNILKGIFGSTAGKTAGLLGIAALANKLLGGGGGGYAGYRGGIPTYAASRTMNTIPTTVANPLAGQTGQPATIPRRPGSGGVTYFSPMTYTLVPPKPAGDGTTNTTTTDTKATEEQVQAGASGGIMSLRNGHLGSYSDGGQLLRGPGDGVSDDIPATIADKQPARLADGEFVIPARIVSELGNGSTEAGARKLYAMMDRIKSARRKAKDIAADTKTDRYLPR